MRRKFAERFRKVETMHRHVSLHPKRRLSPVAPLISFPRLFLIQLELHCVARITQRSYGSLTQQNHRNSTILEIQYVPARQIKITSPPYIVFNFIITDIDMINSWIKYS